MLTVARTGLWQRAAALASAAIKRDPALEEAHLTLWRARLRGRQFTAGLAGLEDASAHIFSHAFVRSLAAACLQAWALERCGRLPWSSQLTGRQRTMIGQELARLVDARLASTGQVGGWVSGRHPWRRAAILARYRGDFDEAVGLHRLAWLHGSSSAVFDVTGFDLALARELIELGRPAQGLELAMLLALGSSRPTNLASVAAARGRFSKALDLSEAGRYQTSSDAEYIAVAWIVGQPERAAAFSGLGASTRLELLIDLNRSSEVALSLAALDPTPRRRFLVRLGRLEEAIATCPAAPTRTARACRVEVHLAAGQLERAWEVLAADPPPTADGEARHRLLRTAMRGGRWSEASALATDHLALAPAWDWNRVQLARLLAADDPQAAWALLEDGLRRSPGLIMDPVFACADWGGRVRPYARTYMRSVHDPFVVSFPAHVDPGGKEGERRESLLARRYPGSWIAHERISQARAARGDLKGALVALRRARRLARDRSGLLAIQEWRLLTGLDRHEEALATARGISGYREADRHQVRTLSTLGRCEEANSLADDLLAELPGDAPFRGVAARAARACGDDARGVRLMNAGRPVSPRGFLVQIGRYHLDAGRPSEALAEAETVLAVEPYQRDALALRRDALAALGSDADALASASLLWKLEPSPAHLNAVLSLANKSGSPQVNARWTAVHRRWSVGAAAAAK